MLDVVAHCRAIEIEVDVGDDCHGLAREGPPARVHPDTGRRARTRVLGVRDPVGVSIGIDGTSVGTHRDTCRRAGTPILVVRDRVGVAVERAAIGVERNSLGRVGTEAHALPRRLATGQRESAEQGEAGQTPRHDQPRTVPVRPESIIAT